MKIVWRLTSFSLIILALTLIAFSKTVANPSDSLNVRNPDSTQITIDTETVPAVIRSRRQELSVLYPLGNFPREETANSGYWAQTVGPQYGQSFFAGQFKIYSRFRPEVPLRYFPEHALTDFHFAGEDSVHYPLRMFILHRNQEPMVNVVYKKGDYALGALSASIALDITKKTHVHLARESESYVGLYGIDNINAERYYLAAYHQVSDRTRFVYNTFYSKDRTNWVGGYPNLQKYGTESTSWYQNFLEWKTQLDSTTLDYGLHLGSQRLWFSGLNLDDKPAELQRGLWLQAQRSIGQQFSAGIRYEGTQFVLSGNQISEMSEVWHELSGNLEYENSIMSINATAGLRHRTISGSANDIYGNLKLTIPLKAGFTFGGAIEQQVRYLPWQWASSNDLIAKPAPEKSATPVTSMIGFAHWQPSQWLVLKVSGGQYSFKNWYSLQYLEPGARTDSTLTLTKYNGHFSHLNAEVEIKPFQWIGAGLRYDVFPNLNQPLPEIWSQQFIAGWLHAERYFFKDNLLLHMYTETGYFTDRQPVGWNPMLQSLTLYPLFRQPQDLGFLHLYFAGEVGPFTLGLSFYNLLSQNLQYALDQRPQTNIFYLSVRWQFWD